MSSISQRHAGREYWRSLDDLTDNPQFREFLHREFPAGAAEMLEDGQGRRHFLKIMGASFVLAGLGLTGCRRWPEEKIVPYANRPEGYIPGSTTQYATCLELGGVATGLLATSYDGRPIKVEGNPDHPDSRGAASALIQASILDLYDPDRSRTVTRSGEVSDWGAFDTWATTHFNDLKSKNGEGLCVLSEATASPSTIRMKQRLAQLYPKSQWHEYESISDDNERVGSDAAFGTPYRSHYKFDQANIIVSLDCDFLSAHPSALRYTRDFASTRLADKPNGSMSRLYMFESALSLTGANADHRVALKRKDVVVIAARLARQLLKNQPEGIEQLTEESISTNLPENELQTLLDQIVSDVNSQEHGAVFVAGSAQPAEVHMLAHVLNQATGAVGHTVDYTELSQQETHTDSLQSLVDAMSGSQVETLLIIGGNPVYDAPADFGFTAALSKVSNTIRLGTYEDETSVLCNWHLPRSHYLEAWSDGRGYDGTISIAQPLIEPLFDTRSAIEILAVLCGEEVRTGQEIVRSTFNKSLGVAASESKWRQTLHDGLLAGSEWPIQRPEMNRSEIAQRLQGMIDHRSSTPQGSMEITFVPSSAVYDGRFANNGWLQELPDPLTKLTWDNALQISVAKAGDLALDNGDVVRITIGSSSIEAPVIIVPGQYDESATISLGYGRKFDGRICTGAGTDISPLRTVDAMWFAGGMTLQKTGSNYPLGTTQDHHAIDVEHVAGKDIQKRLPRLFREANLDEYQHHPDFAKHGTHTPHLLSLWEENNLNNSKHRWAMSIDLSACTGCGACVTACQAENNFPIVGKDQVIQGREMHWMRIDRYFKFDQTDDHYDANKLKSVALQPVTCHHCENAPCEQVCPVAATIHDEDGLNVMVYNRCVGTRYCSNNCPYKVRRFNFFDFHRREPHREQPGSLMHVDTDYYTKPQAEAHELHQMQFNPEVTVRMRGVMEKCTLCTQRITETKIRVKNEWVQSDPDQRSDVPVIHDGEIKTACQQTCPAQAIVFGDLNDPESRISQLHRHQRSYAMLEELNVKPRLLYMANLRNQAPNAQAPTEHQSTEHPSTNGGSDH